MMTPLNALHAVTRHTALVRLLMTGMIGVFASPLLVAARGVEPAASVNQIEHWLSIDRERERFLHERYASLPSEQRAARLEAIEDKFLPLEKAVLGAEHTVPLRRMERRGSIASANQDFSESVRWFDQSATGKKQFFGTSHWIALEAANQLEGERKLASIAPTALHRFDVACQAMQSGDGLMRRGKLADGKALLERAMSETEQTIGRSNPFYLAAAKSHARCLSELGDHTGARTLAMEAYQLSEQCLGARHPQSLQLLLDLAQFDIFLRQFTSAADRLRVINEVLGDDPIPYGLEALDNLRGNLLRETHQYQEAIAAFERCLALLDQRSGSSAGLRANVLNNLGVTFASTGDLIRAEKIHQQALQIRAREKNVPGAAQSLLQLGSVFREQGKYDESRRALFMATQMRAETFGVSHPSTLRVLNELARVEMRDGKYAEAEATLAQVIQVAKEGEGMSQILRIATFNRAIALSHLERTEEAATLLAAVIHSGQAMDLENDPGLEPPMELDFSRASQGDRDALVRLQTQIPILDGQRPYSRDAIIRKSRLSRALRGHDWRASVEELHTVRQNIRIYASRVLPGLSDDDQFRFFSEQRAIGSYTKWLDAGGLDDADRKWLTELSAEWVLNDKGVASEVIAARQQWLCESQQGNHQQQASLLRTVLGDIALRQSQGSSPSSELDALIAQVEALQAELGTRAVMSHGNAWVSLPDVREALASDECLVEYIRGPDDENNDAYFAWLIPPPAKGDCRLLPLGSAATIDHEIAVLYEHLDAFQQIQTEFGSNFRRLKPKLDENRTQIDQQLLVLANRLVPTELRERMAPFEHWIIGPDSQIWSVPFDALRIESQRTGNQGITRYAIVDHEIELTVTGRHLTRKPTLPRSDESLVIYDPDFGTGDGKSRFLRLQESSGWLSLPGTGVQVEGVLETLQHITGSKPRSFQGEAAQGRVLLDADRPRFLIAASHGYAKTPSGNDEHSLAMMECGMVFAGANQEPLDIGSSPYVPALQMTALNLRGTELAFLSACDSSQGRIQAGEGMTSVRQAFHLAGAEGVIATLWPIYAEEGTATLVRTFWNQLGSGKDAAESLRHAKRTVMDEEETGHPIYWAPFSLSRVTRP